ncbi:phosphate/phosphite/phosphonate ABC transporter substrate-binding protein [Pseudovibrio sp. Tun.PSC04-5.I4]|uniref:phosphate/phosphite/phosphonate ABC transporter substrate-binding protein n=1 Tax=Pseudovibrio sp. Tun.PSC04-5.I4 TaxID=1798213 RepID=UPI0008841DF5|nr:phosphate/phosphite/phosphonate ABC transporter substrate-binding protein [Pseudovibrio sp. Tun.PSC04-5.I4]SDR16641.1 phosphonate transport system substrate-binding protein [Pseudovibrio sp. Tun.PSC04-5.I4]
MQAYTINRIAPISVVRNLLCGCFTAMLLTVCIANASDCPAPSGLNSEYTDSNCDLLADPPEERSSLRNPDTLVWAYTPIEEPNIYAELFRPFTRYLEECTQRQIVYYPVQSAQAQIDAFRRGRLHFAGFSTGATVKAVQQAGAHPFAAKGTLEGIRRYNSIAIVSSSSTFSSLTELVGRKVAHTSYQSNSGHYAALHFFPNEGLEPNTDYDPIMTGGHGQSILGLINGDYDMAVVASDVFDRMAERGRINKSDFRILYSSPLFPTSSFAYAHNLDSTLVEQLQSCFFEFEFPPRMIKEFRGDNRFLPVQYDVDWLTVRRVIESGKAMQN